MIIKGCGSHQRLGRQGAPLWDARTVNRAMFHGLGSRKVLFLRLCFVSMLISRYRLRNSWYVQPFLVVGSAAHSLYLYALFIVVFVEL